LRAQYLTISVTDGKERRISLHHVIEEACPLSVISGGRLPGLRLEKSFFSVQTCTLVPNRSVSGVFNNARPIHLANKEVVARFVEPLYCTCGS
jgi:hypothetical protein